MSRLVNNEKGAKICRCAFRNAAETRSQPETVRDNHKEGLEFVYTIFSCTAPLAPEEIELYGFLLRLVSFGGMLPLSSMKRWGLMGTLDGTVRKEYAKVTASTTELPKEEVQEVIKEIWGEMPKGFCV